MGLDMNLFGRKSKWNYDETEDGFTVNAKILDLGYWRKHPNLHGFIVETFADGVDECQQIDLSAENLREIISAVKDDKLPHTEGFFFGESAKNEEQRLEDVEVLTKALDWLETQDKDTWRSVYYQVSW